MSRKQNSGWSRYTRIAKLPVILFLLVMAVSVPATAQDNGFIVSEEVPRTTDGITQAYTDAETMLSDGLITMNEATLRSAAAKYESIIEDYALDDRHFDAYFAASMIFTDFLQSLTDYEHAKNLLSLLITRHQSNNQQVADALLTRAGINYKCLGDYRAAQEDLSAILNTPSLAESLSYAEQSIKIMLAKCRQKLGEYDQAQRIWTELHFTNPEVDTEGRKHWIENSDQWYYVDAGDVRLYFEQTIERDMYTQVVADYRNSISMVEASWGMIPGPSVDVYLYDSEDHLFDYTLRSDGFAIPQDLEIHMTPKDIDQIDHLTGWVLSQRLNSRSASSLFPLLRAGIANYFMADRADLDMEAARGLYFYGGRIDDIDLLFPLSFDYTYSKEYVTISASFVHYLIEEHKVDAYDLLRFYRLVWSRPAIGWQSLWAKYISSWDLGDNATTWARDLVTPEIIYSLAESNLGINLRMEITAWEDSLQDDVQAVEAEIGLLTAEIQKVSVNCTTPVDTLESWWSAYRAGDFDAMIECSTHEMGSVLSEARDLYEEQGILEQVILDRFVRPNRQANMIVIQQGEFGEGIYVFEVKIERGSDVQEMTIVVRKEGEKWKVDAN